MDGNKTEYRQTFEKLAKRNGEVVAVVSDTDGERFASTERELLEEYLEAATHNAAMPDDLKASSARYMELDQYARAQIQAYKRKHGIPLDTPPVEDTKPPSEDDVRAYAEEHNLPYVPPSGAANEPTEAVIFPFEPR